MFSISVDGPEYMYGDNKSVLANSLISESRIDKKSYSIAFNFIREGNSSDKWRVTYMNTNDNVAALLTKPLVGEKRKNCIRRLLRYLHKE
mmetsp:Transcript_28162/g.26991  ORF Transcript_28162/g.26991 Transcript_28162/m.26991 type:complete len:90 (-) Transcript_28162:378-647(-)